MNFAAEAKKTDFFEMRPLAFGGPGRFNLPSGEALGRPGITEDALISGYTFSRQAQIEETGCLGRYTVFDQMQNLSCRLIFINKP